MPARVSTGAEKGLIPVAPLWEQTQYQPYAHYEYRRRQRPAAMKRWPQGSTDPADVQLRLDCEWDWQLFAERFFPHIFDLPFNAVHLEYYALKATRHGSRGHHDAVAAPRGSSKTTGCALLTILHACCYPGEESFILYATNSAENAEQKVKQVRDELTDNAELARVYGSRQGTPWNQGHFRTVRTSDYDSTTVLAAGRLTQIRGATQRFRRPSLLLIDDIEHPEQVLSEIQRQRTKNWLYNDVLKLGDQHTNAEVSGTILHPQALLRELLDSPGWTTRFYQAVTAFADASSVPLWQEWRTIFLNKGNPQHQEDARAFFEAHQHAMLRGHDVLWSARKDYYALMVERLVEGEASFWQELQNEPLGDQRYLFDMDASAYCRLTPEGIWRADSAFVPWLDVPEVAAYFDPALGRGGDCACCVVVAQDKAGYEYVLDAYVSNVDSPEDQDGALVELLWRWQVPVLGVENNGFQSLLPRNIREAIRRRAQAEGHPRWDVGLVPITHTSNKILRIKTLEPLVANQWLIFSRLLPSEFYRQFAEFIPVEGAGRDDCPDATEGGLAVLRGKYRRQDTV